MAYGQRVCTWLWPCSSRARPSHGMEMRSCDWTRYQASAGALQSARACAMCWTGPWSWTGWALRARGWSRDWHTPVRGSKVGDWDGVEGWWLCSKCRPATGCPQGQIIRSSPCTQASWAQVLVRTLRAGQTVTGGSCRACAVPQTWAWPARPAKPLSPAAFAAREHTAAHQQAAGAQRSMGPPVGASRAASMASQLSSGRAGGRPSRPSGSASCWRPTRKRFRLVSGCSSSPDCGPTRAGSAALAVHASVHSRAPGPRSAGAAGALSLPTRPHAVAAGGTSGA